jgi:hypothetical protein
MSVLNGSLTRGVVLRVPKDLDPGQSSVIDTIASSGPTEGELLLDDSSRRAAVRVIGDPTRYEATWPLLPGWRPDEHWDVAESGVDEAIAFSRTKEFADLYATEGPYYRAAVGRYWVLNEHGGFTAAEYKRATGPWAEEQLWWPFAFEDNLADLALRGARGWSTRRRQFLPPISLWPDLQRGAFPLFLELSFTGDDGPFYACNVTLAAETDHCGVRIGLEDLRQIRDMNYDEDRDKDTGLYEHDFVQAYIRGQLRVFLTAVVEGDDCLRATAHSDGDWPLGTWAYLLRRRQLRREMVAPLVDSLRENYGLSADERDDRAEAATLAQRALDACVRRAPGRCNIPYILTAADDVSWDNYRIGDEVIAIRTGDADQDVELTHYTTSGHVRPRVVGITHRWNSEQAGMGTELVLEDQAYDVELPVRDEAAVAANDTVNR